jgi:glycosyltransferase involved in cell wall biosynthesis
MRVLLGMPDKKAWGGPIYCEPPFVAGLRELGVEADEEIYIYGDSARGAAAQKRVARVLDAAWRLRRRARAKSYDVIHLNTSFDEKSALRDVTTLRFLRSLDAPVYLKMHGSAAAFLRTEKRAWRRLQQRIFAQAAAIGVLSSEERENFIRAGCPPEKLFPAKYVVEADEFRPDPQFQRKHGLAAETPVLLFSARFIPAKGLLDVLAACAQVKEAGRDFALFCLGDGPLRGEAEKLAAELGLAENTRFFGYIPEEETAAFHANSTAFVFPTYHDEGFPLVLLKSLAAGLPMITTRLRGAADYFQDPQNCLWVEPRNPSQLAAKITQLLTDNNLREQMADNNRRLAKEFSRERVAQEYLAVYQFMQERYQT